MRVRRCSRALILAGLGGVSMIVFKEIGSPIAAFLAGAFVISSLMSWVYCSYMTRIRAGQSVPGWLIALERLREYLAVEAPPTIDRAARAQ
jgi:hypothetical protein